MSGFTTLSSLHRIAMLALAALIVGCASTATGVKNTRINTTTAPQDLTAQIPPGTVMAVLRYPAYIEEAAEEKFHNLYASRTLGSRLYSDDAGLEETAAIADIMLLKSNYFALSIFKELAKRMPEHSVLLSPHAIKLDENGYLTSEPMTQAEALSAPQVDGQGAERWSHPSIWVKVLVHFAKGESKEALRTTTAGAFIRALAQLRARCTGIDASSALPHRAGSRYYALRSRQQLWPATGLCRRIF